MFSQGSSVEQREDRKIFLNFLKHAQDHDANSASLTLLDIFTFTFFS